MANSRIMLTCRHCGEQICIGKGYHGVYSTVNDNLHNELNKFYEKHKESICTEEINCSDNAREHFEIREFFENPEDVPDVVEVVRCKDCINVTEQTNEDVIRCRLSGRNYPNNHFCSYGERKEDEGK